MKAILTAILIGTLAFANLSAWASFSCRTHCYQYSNECDTTCS